MGQSDPKHGSRDYRQIVQDFNVKRKLNDPRFGEVTILEQKNNREEIILREKTTNNTELYERELVEFRNRMQNKHPNVMQFLYYATKSENQFCSTFHKTYLLFEYSDRTLEDLISAKINSSAHFSEEELWKITKGLTEGLSFLQKRRIFHGELRPYNIYYSKTGDYKIFDQGLLDGKRSFIDLCTTQNFHTHNPYFSPLLVKAIEQKQMQPRHNEVKSDVYSLGMCILHAANLESNDDCYDFTRGVIDGNLVERKLRKMQERYSPHLVSVVRRMLSDNESARPDFVDLSTVVTSAASQSQVSPAQVDQHALTATTNITTNVAGASANTGTKVAAVTNNVVVANNSLASQAKDPVSVVQNYTVTSSPSTGFNPATTTQTTKTIVETHVIESTKNAPPDYHENYSGASTNYSGANYLNSYSESKYLPGGTYSSPVYSPSTDYSRKEEVKHTSVGDVNYDDINALLRKYGIEPIQPRSYTNAPGTTLTSTATTNFTGPSTSYSNSYQFSGGQGATKYEPSSYIREESTVKSYNAYGDSAANYTPSYLVQETRKSTQGVDVLTRLDGFPKKEYTSVGASDYLFNQGYSTYEHSKASGDPSVQSAHYYQSSSYAPVQTQLKREIVVEEYQNRSRYEGEKIGDQRNGHGKFYYSDGGVYDGEWMDNKMHGRGTLYYSSGKPAYVGDWHYDKFEGSGTLYNEYPAPLYDEFDYTDFDNIKDFWTSYDGSFKDDNKEGYGVLNLTNGDKFQGYFQEDAVNGPGKYIKKNGQIIEGNWFNNKLVR